jgi:hypothetical protein
MKSKLDKMSEIRQNVYKLGFVDYIENNKIGITLEELGLTKEDLNNKKYIHKISEEDTDKNSYLKFSKSLDMKFRIMNLYRYVSDFYDDSNVGDNTRDFCKRMVSITSDRLLSFNDIVGYNNQNPGFGKGGGDSYSIFNYRGGSNCKHKWLKYKYDTQSGQLIEAPDDEQQPWQPV